MLSRKITLRNQLTIGGGAPWVLIAGPCAIESEKIAMKTAEFLKPLCVQLDIPLVFKSSFDKANRSSVYSPRGVGLKEGLRILKKIKTDFDLPVTTDVHEPWQCEPVSEVADILQIPAFLARQTDLLIAAAHTGRPVNVKKAQFMAPTDMGNVQTKLHESGCDDVLFCERGTCFGYGTLVVDFTGFVEMKRFGCPVVFDATHSVQKPGGHGTSSGGRREMVAPLVAAAMAIGTDALFLETHPDPSTAISDAENQIPLDQLRPLLESALRISQAAGNWS